MTKVLLVFGTRPEAIKLFPVIRALEQRPGIVVRTCITAQHREMLDQVLAAAGIVPDIDLDLMRPGQSLDTLTARSLVAVGEVMDRDRPDLVIVQGDTTTALAGALAAYHRQIPVGHVEAGLRSGDLHQPWPEEGNRRMVTVLARHHWAPTAHAARTLAAEGVAPAAIAMTGNTVIDALLWMRQRIAEDATIADGLDAAFARATGKRLLLVTAHRRENLGPPLVRIAQAITRIAARGDVAILLPVHPNPAVGRCLGSMLDAVPGVILTPPLDYPHCVRALTACDLVLTDSGGLQEEAPALAKPVLVLRETTERREAVMAGTARLIGTYTDRIVAEVSVLLDDAGAYAAMARAHHPFGDGHAAERIADAVVRAYGSAGALQAHCLAAAR